MEFFVDLAGAVVGVDGEGLAGGGEGGEPLGFSRRSLRAGREGNPLKKSSEGGPRRLCALFKISLYTQKGGYRRKLAGRGGGMATCNN